uniref:MULE domain-containing protein n=1 Tax=Haemonchus contortus TaxID=6289 RepID=A0A7I5E8C4_HAECO
MRKDYESKECKLYFVTKKDLWNVMTKYKLTPGLRDRDDVTSLELREQERNPSDGIRFFKKQDEPSGKGFVLVIITPRQQRWLDQFASKGIAVDDTHNVTRYALKLATVMVIDDRDRGLPAAFLLSGEMTAKEVKILFDEIKKIVPNFAPKSLVSDEALAFYNGFKSSFPDREPELQRGIIGAFRNLLRISDEATFHARLGEVLTHLRLKNCSRLIQYLQREYLGEEKIKKWAAFRRQGVVMSTSMYTERWHLRLKQEKLKRKANSRIDYVVDTLIKAVEELALDFEIRDRRQLVSSYRMRENNIQHKLAVRFYKESSDKIHKVGDLAWNVYSATSGTVYRVEFDGHCVCSPQTNTHCSRCHVCPYSFTCSCRSGALAGVACLHGHAVKFYGQEETVQEGQEETVQGQEEIVQERREEIVQESTFIELQPEPRGVVIVHSERDPGPIRDIRGELHALRDDIAKSYTMIHAKVNALVRQEDENALDTLTALAERLRVIAGDTNVPLEAAGIVSRPDVPAHGRPKMQKSELYSRARIRKEMRRKTQSVEDIRVDPEEILFCSICFEEDPTLPEDMDPEEPDARETQWMRCTECRVWAHAVCARGVQQRKCRACKKGMYSIYV